MNERINEQQYTKLTNCFSFLFFIFSLFGRIGENHKNSNLPDDGKYLLMRPLWIAG